MSELPTDLTGQNRWAARAKRAGIGVVVAAFVIAGLYGGYLVWDRVDWAPETEGTIFVETPQVYTRERLVNDRFVQESWLRNELEGKATFGPSETVTTTSRRAISLRTAPGGSGASPNASAPTSAPDQSGANADQATGRAAPGVPPSVDFLLRNAHRELVRAHLIENQLDDRHDIRGTTIYMLKFDASVLPGNNTKKAAFVRVKATQDAPPSGARTTDAVIMKYLQLKSDEAASTDPDLGEHVALYTDWRRSLRDRFNSQFSEILRRFNANEFRYAEYYEMMASVDRTSNSLDMFYSLTNLLAKLQTEREGLARTRRDERFLGDLDQRFHLAAKYILYYAAAGKPLPTFKRLSGLLNGEEPDELPPNADPLQTVLLRYAVRRFGKVVIGDNSLRLGTLSTNPGSSALAESKTLDPFVSITLSKLTRDGQEALELDADERQVPLALFDTAEVQTIHQEKDKCLGRDGKDLREAFDRQYSLLTRYQDSGRDVSVFYVNQPDSHANPESLVPIAVLTPERLNLTLSNTYESKAPAPFDPCLKFARHRILHVGWLNFVAGILDMQIYTYATFPRYDALVTDSTFDASRAEALAVDLQASKTSGEMSNQLRQVARMVESKPSVVGFSGFCSQQIPSGKERGFVVQQPAFCRNDRGTDDLNFGWALYPPTQAGSRYGGSVFYRPMPPTQRSLSALVTVPSFWKRAKLEVQTGWINNNGSFTIGNGYAYTVTLPLDYEALDTILVGPARRDSQRPSIAIERLPDNIEVEACQRAEILIPGRRLWRSTVVVLSGQRANEVLVLPDMRGIIATFYKIAPRGSLDPPVTERELQVWTSEGMAGPLPVIVKGPVDCTLNNTAPDSKTVATGR